MTKDNKTSSEKFSALRKQAEALIAQSGKNLKDIPIEDVRKMAHEFFTYQIELELQNEDLRQTQILLEQGRSRYMDLYDFAPVGYLTLNDKGIIIEANLTAAEMLGVGKRNLFNKRLSSFIVEEDQDIYYHYKKNLLATKESQTCELRMRDKEGHLFWSQIKSSNLADFDGSGGHVRITLNDISEQKKQEQLILEIRLQQEQLKRLESLKTKAGAIAHRFNNSMMVVLGNLGLMIQTLPANSKEKQMASEVLQAAEGASRVGSMMLSYVGQQPLQLQVLSFADLVEESIKELKSQLKSSISLKFVSPPEPLYCSVDPQQIKEVIQSIITNAIESLDNIGGEIEISFGADHFKKSSFPLAFQGSGTKSGMYSFCQVRDTGHGITLKNIEHLFEPFFTTKFVGRGLGLALCVGVMHSHHGAVLVESTPGGRTTFRILLPVIESFQEKSASPVGPREDFLKLSGDIVFADDEDIVRAIGKNMLESLGFTVHTAVNGLEAVEMVQRRDIDYRAVMLDVSMPVMNGIEAMKEIRKSNADLPILLSSGYSEANIPFDKDSTGKPDGFLQKPLQLSTLKKSFEKLLS